MRFNLRPLSALAESCRCAKMDSPRKGWKKTGLKRGALRFMACAWVGIVIFASFVVGSIPALGQPSPSESGYVVYRAVETYTLEARGQTPESVRAGTARGAASAWLIEDPSLGTRFVIRLDTKRKTYSFGPHGAGREFGEPISSHPFGLFGPGRTQQLRSGKNVLEIRTYSEVDREGLLADESGASPADIDGDYYLTTQTVGRVFRLSGALKSIRLPGNKTIHVPPALTGTGSIMVSDLEHFDFSVREGELSQTPGVLHTLVKVSAAYRLDAKLTALANGLGDLTDAEGNALDPGTPAYAVRAVELALRKLKYARE